MSGFSPQTLLRAAQEARPTSSFFGSLAAMPINAIGSLAHKVGLRTSSTPLGTQLIDKGMVQPLTRATDFVDELGGKALGELPGVEYLFRRSIRPDDLAFAAKKIPIDEKTLASLMGKAVDGTAGHAHRLSAPIESDFFRNMVLPLGAGAFALDQLKATPESRAREAIQMKHNQDLKDTASERKRLAKRYLGIDNETMPKLSHAAHAPHAGEETMSDHMQKQAAAMLLRLTQALKNSQKEIDALRVENELWKQASSMAQDGLLPSDRINDFVQQHLPHELSVKMAGQRMEDNHAEKYSVQNTPRQTSSGSLPHATEEGHQKSASLLGLLDDDHGSLKTGAVGTPYSVYDRSDDQEESVVPTAKSMMVGFLLGGSDETYPM